MDPAEPMGGARGAARTEFGTEVHGAASGLPVARSASWAAAMLPLTVNFKVSSRTLTGALNAHNKAAVDW